MSAIEHLAQQQLDAYNRSDLDGFVACYHPAVRVFDGNEQTINGIDEFRIPIHSTDSFEVSL